MSARILDGKALAAKIRQQVARGVEDFVRRVGHPPGLGVVLVGQDPASAVYVRNKEKSALETGMHSQILRLPAEASRAQVLDAIGRMADDPRFHGILVQLPLPDHLDAEEIQQAVPPEKDVDGFHPVSAGRLLLGQQGGFVPCTPKGILAQLDEAGTSLRGAEVVIVGRSNIVGKPAALLLLARHATVTVCHSRTRDLEAVCSRADVLVASVGRPGLIRGRHIKPGAVVIDVGINRVDDRELAEDLLSGQPRRWERFLKKGHTLVGDVHFGEARERAGAVTPVPGGVGPLTVAMLLENTLEGARRSAGWTG
ncbi:MAG: bifunctional 5,10-methylenetetrahydrofolate dehydrogenase/5,10-methenyltetrahydrofolate cyclohydrolase [Acidobacteriota bacterium]|nr:bifunctional 5,10-methylenetetrahydrofolate dehydrogenase/5,10-methenyltetrahydrofolate cyclohydrolase [Acidobacteriota bacterium]MDQ7088120.1 bifunctional 5,10-methylenetetrahydrofolate dehydrogenase/5,10-methenyltetrahydrofolate cyclohydrolase [Acidobacteriota bacterium]